MYSIFRLLFPRLISHCKNFTCYLLKYCLSLILVFFYIHVFSHLLLTISSFLFQETNITNQFLKISLLIVMINHQFFLLTSIVDYMHHPNVLITLLLSILHYIFSALQNNRCPVSSYHSLYLLKYMLVVRYF